jgi:hypothetical protein
VKYLNHKDVKKAIHVDDSIKWTECSYSLKYSYADSAISTAPIYQYLIDGGYGLNIMVYSGDDDSVCATIGTQEWVRGCIIFIKMTDRYLTSDMGIRLHIIWLSVGAIHSGRSNCWIYNQMEGCEVFPCNSSWSRA